MLHMRNGLNRSIGIENYQLSFIRDFDIKMSQREDNQCEYEELDELRQEVRLTSSKLLDLTYNQNQYIDKLEEYNLRAKDLIAQDFIEEALVYLNEAERLLEYGASCGKSIDRNLIITTLHNEACCYYKASDLPTASKYVEAVIYNLNSCLNSLHSTPSHSGTSERRGHKPDDDLMALQTKVDLIHYYLKYCTINSQAKNRILALDAGKRALQLLKSLMLDLKDPKLPVVSEGSNEVEVEDLRGLLGGVKIFREDIRVDDVDKYLQLARGWVSRWNKNKLIKKISFGLEKHVSNYSISEVIDMVGLQYLGEGVERVILNSKTIMKQLLHFPMAYFTISTEYRLISENLYKDAEERVLSEQYKKASIYQLQAVIFLAMYLNCDLVFMRQIIASYEHHFKISLTQSENQPTDLEALADGLLFQRVLPRKKSVNSSLMAKIQKMRSKSKDKAKLQKVHTEYQDTQIYQSKACYQLNTTKSKTKTKRSVSKPVHPKKPRSTAKILNDSLFESINNLNAKPRSVSGSKQLESHKNLERPKQQHRKRSLSKDSQPLRVIKHQSPPLPTKPVAKVKTSAKRTIDQYQLCKAKISSKKRSQSISSADLSCTAKDLNNLNKSKDLNPLNKTKLSGSGKTEKSKSKATKKKSENRSRPKAVREGKEVFSKHYYV